MDHPQHPWPTIAFAAQEFGVSAKTVREWINRRIIPEPPRRMVGIREIFVFPPDYMERAQRALAEARDNRAKRRKASSAGHETRSGERGS